MTRRDFEFEITIIISAFLLLIFLLLGIADYSKSEYELVTLKPIHINKVIASEPEMMIVDTLEATPADLEEEQWYDSLEYLACCVEAEAGNQSELGKRLVCDTVLNRFDLGKYETLYDVINEESQYSVVSNGMILEVVPSEETYRIVAEEIENRTNTEVLYFRTKHYHKFGTPLFKEGDHYFSK